MIAGTVRHPAEDVTMRNGRLAGRLVQTDTPRYAGGYMTRWAAFAGGNHVGDYADHAEAVRELKDYAERASFGWHLALCDSGRSGHNDVCPCR